jgi:hypothetical protein
MSLNGFTQGIEARSGRIRFALLGAEEHRPEGLECLHPGQASLNRAFWNYNICWMHSTIRCTRAMAAGVARKPQRVADLLAA